MTTVSVPHPYSHSVISLTTNPTSFSERNHLSEQYFSLGLQFETNREFSRAIFYFSQCHQLGHPQATYHLSFCEKQIKVSQFMEMKHAVESPSHPDLDLVYRLGIMYETGFGVDPSIQDAIRWYMYASRRGHRLSYLRMIGFQFQFQG